jgi:hypothetical protein
MSAIFGQIIDRTITVRIAAFKFQFANFKVSFTGVKIRTFLTWYQISLPNGQESSSFLKAIKIRPPRRCSQNTSIWDGRDVDKNLQVPLKWQGLQLQVVLSSLTVL